MSPLFDLARHWNTEKCVLIEFLQNQNWSQPFLPFTILFVSNIAAKMTKPNFLILKEWRFLFILQPLLQCRPIMKVFPMHEERITRETCMCMLFCICFPSPKKRKLRVPCLPTEAQMRRWGIREKMYMHITRAMRLGSSPFL
jgi:hypothetical protein